MKKRLVLLWFARSWLILVLSVFVMGLLAMPGGLKVVAGIGAFVLTFWAFTEVIDAL